MHFFAQTCEDQISNREKFNTMCLNSSEINYSDYTWNSFGNFNGAENFDTEQSYLQYFLKHVELRH